MPFCLHVIVSCCYLRIILGWWLYICVYFWIHITQNNSSTYKEWISNHKTSSSQNIILLERLYAWTDGPCEQTIFFRFWVCFRVYWERDNKKEKRRDLMTKKNSKTSFHPHVWHQHQQTKTQQWYHHVHMYEGWICQFTNISTHCASLGIA